jgi:broad specificity phosphatase PhoE
MPTASKIMVIRHAEKPTAEFDGVKETGESSGHDLSVRGWQRAGALACLFAPARGPLQDPLLARPDFLFASGPSEDHEAAKSKSRRSQETVTPLAAALGLEVNSQFSKGQERALVANVITRNGVVLIAWQHENISAIAAAIPCDDAVPQNWPEARFDVVFVFTLEEATNKYRFGQVAQRLLHGDSDRGL